MTASAHWHEPAFVPDVCSSDTEAEKLAEAADLTTEQAELVIEWLNTRRKEDAARVKAEQLTLFVSMLIPKRPRTMEAIILGLFAALGILDRAGYASQAQAAREMATATRCPKCRFIYKHTVTRALVSHYATRWSDLLEIEDNRFCRSRNTRKKCAHSAEHAKC